MPAPPLAALARQLGPDREAVSDADLLDRFARTSDGASFELLVWRHGGMVWAACRRVLGADVSAAEDASQAAFAALARHAGRVRRGSAVGPWLHRVAVRAALDLLAAGRGQRELPAIHPADPHPDPSQLAADREIHALIDAAVNALPDRLRGAFVLCELEGHTNAEAAVALGCPVGTVESRLTRARQQLRTRLAAKGVTPVIAVGAGAALPVSIRAALVASARGGVSAAVQALAARAAGGSGGTVRVVVAAGLVLVASVTGLGVAADDSPCQPTPPPVKRAIAAATAPDGDRQPAPAPVARFGSSRMRHAGAVTDLAYSPDGSRLVSAGADHAVRMWDAETGKAVFVVAREDGRLERVGFADSGKVVVAAGRATAGRGGELWRIDAATGAVAGKFGLPATGGGDFDARFSPDGGLVALSAPIRREVAVAETATGATLWTCDLPGGATPTAVGFSADGKSVAFGTASGAVQVMKADTGGNPKTYRRGDGKVAAVALSPTGRLVAAAYAGSGITAWDRASGEERWTSLARGDNGLVFTRDGKLLFRTAVGSRASTLDAANGALPDSCGVPGTFFASVVQGTCAAIHTGPYHPDDDRVAFGTAGGAIGVFGLYSDREGKPMPASADPPTSVGELWFTPNGKTLRGRAGDWYAWDVATGKQTRLTTAGWTGGEPLSPDGRFTARVYRSSWLADRGDPEQGVRLEVLNTHNGRTVSFHAGVRFEGVWQEFTPDGGGILSAGRDGTMRVWELATGEERCALVGHATPPRFRAFSGDGKSLVTATRNDPPARFPIVVWDLTAGTPRAMLDSGGPVGGVAVSRDGGRVAAQESGSDRATVWEVVSGKVLARVPQGGDAGYVALSPDGRVVAVSARWKGEVRVYAVDGGAERVVFRHAGEVTGLAFAPDGRTLAVASKDTPVTLWDVTGPKR